MAEKGKNGVVCLAWDREGAACWAVPIRAAVCHLSLIDPIYSTIWWLKGDGGGVELCV